MPGKNSIIITSIAAPNPVMKQIAGEAQKKDLNFIVVGDSKSPSGFHLEGCRFLSLEEQKKLAFKLSGLIPEKGYSRKNLGYLLAASEMSSLIQETDDDNFPRDEFWNEKKRYLHVPVLPEQGWVNVYHYFTHDVIWPRGLPLSEIRKELPALDTFKSQHVLCPVQQGLADENPDVDAVYRLTYPLPVNFQPNRLALGAGSWCPFNSQNTTWFKEAFMLMYLPSFCSFRMTDIWRSFVAQRIMWENNWHLLFHEATMWQDRNEHNLMKDFADEVPGYLNNDRIAKTLEDLNLNRGTEYLGDNLIKCYKSLIDLGVVGQEEEALVHAWVEDMGSYV